MQRWGAALAFTIEAAFVVILGIIVGTILGLITELNLFRGEGVGPEGADFIVP